MINMTNISSVIFPHPPEMVPRGPPTHSAGWEIQMKLTSAVWYKELLGVDIHAPAWISPPGRGCLVHPRTLFIMPGWRNR